MQEAHRADRRDSEEEGEGLADARHEDIRQEDARLRLFPEREPEGQGEVDEEP